MAPLPEANPTLQCVVVVLAMLKGGFRCWYDNWLSEWQFGCFKIDSGVSCHPTLCITCFGRSFNWWKYNADYYCCYTEWGDTSDPSNYWISVINAGRHFSLGEVMGSSMKDSEGVGKVIGRLMMIADVLQSIQVAFHCVRRIVWSRWWWKWGSYNEWCSKHDNQGGRCDDGTISKGISDPRFLLDWIITPSTCWHITYALDIAPVVEEEVRAGWHFNLHVIQPRIRPSLTGTIYWGKIWW